MIFFFQREITRDWNVSHERQAKFCLQVVVFFLGDLPFLPNLTIDLAQNE